MARECIDFITTFLLVTARFAGTPLAAADRSRQRSQIAREGVLARRLRRRIQIKHAR
jgi:hypothetical protein